MVKHIILWQLREELSAEKKQTLKKKSKAVWKHWWEKSRDFWL